MLCDTCIYRDCEIMNCSECKFLRRRRTSYGHITDICYCDYECHCEGKEYQSDEFVQCKYYLSKQELFKREDEND